MLDQAMSRNSDMELDVDNLQKTEEAPKKEEKKCNVPPPPKCASRAQILRNLKWFTRQLAPSLEDALQAKLHRGTDGLLGSDGSGSGGEGRGKAGVAKSWCRSLTNSPLLRRLSPKHHSSRQNSMGTPSRAPLASQIANQSDPRLARLLLVLARTTPEQRSIHARHFAQHIALVYEYQIGMLRGLGPVSDVVRFVADLVVKAVRLNFVTELNSRQLNPTLFFLNVPMPRSGTKIVKTQRLGPGTELAWRICDMFARSGLRHNRVGGQDCSNLTISTHFYAASGSPAYSYRPDVYGYRNVIAIESSEHAPSGIRLYQLSKLDQDTLECGWNTTNTSSNSNGGITTNNSGGSTSSSQGGVGGAITPLSTSSANEQCMDHWHKCYKSLLFLVCDRWEVCDHLEHCDSFGVFCTRERIRPVMQLNTATSPPSSACLTDVSSLLQSFDVLSIPPGSPLLLPDPALDTSDSLLDTANFKSTHSPANSNEDLHHNRDRTESFSRTLYHNIYDNPAFVC